MSYIRVDLSNTNNKWVGFGLANVDTFIIRVWFGLTNIDTIYTLKRHEYDPSTRIVALNYIQPKPTKIVSSSYPFIKRVILVNMSLTQTQL